MTAETWKQDSNAEGLETLVAVTKYMTAINLLAEAFENEFVANELAPKCTEEFLTDSNLNLTTLEGILCTTSTSVSTT